jgi:serine/threonine protein phosphatase PrpC
LIAVVHNNKLYVANAGDCKACILRKNKDGNYERIKISKTFNANKKYEQDRLKKEFKGEGDIIVSKDKKSCYVKGNLMPTRSFGDLRLKKPEFNFHNHPKNLGYRAPIP